MPSHHLRMVIEDRCFTAVKPYPHRETLCVEITEAQDRSALEALTITDMQEGDVCFTFDIGGGDDAQYSPCLKTGEQNGHQLKFNKRCDFIIVRICGGNVYVYFGDLKSKVLRKERIYRQLYASQLFFDYILSILKWEFPKFDAMKGYIAKYVCCHDKDAKQPRETIRKGMSQVRTAREPVDKIHFVPVTVQAHTKNGTVSFNQLCA